MASSSFFLDENNSYVVTFNLVDQDNSAIVLASLGTFQCTEYYYNPDIKTSDRYHLATINGRYNQDVKNANNITVSASGSVTWDLRPEDSAKLQANTDQELHLALFTWYWGSNSKQNSHEFNLYIRRVQYAP